MRRRRFTRLALVVLLTVAGAGCTDTTSERPGTSEAPPVNERDEDARPTTSGAAPSAGERCPAGSPEPLVPEVVRTLEHDPEAYTQGLVVHNGRLFESTGLEGRSSIRELDPDSGKVLRSEPLDDDVFGEGLAVGREDRLVQLTWTEGIAYERDAETFAEVGRFTYDGEGWGLTTLDDGRLVMSDGSDILTIRDPATFEALDEVTVRRAGGDADRLNELEFDGTSIWANRYQTDEVLRIDLDCAQVTGVLDVGALADDARDAARRGDPEPEVSNGVAHLPGTQRYLLTGKRWPTLYEVVLRSEQSAQ
jgi:glutamine cyclotransferase